MSYLALARKWRPKIFSEVIGQAHVVSALSNALNNQRVHHAFLFAGTRGVGKTTLARIFAKALNCATGVSADPCGQCVACNGVDQGNFVDLIEVDAASRTKVDDTRELLDNVQYTPTQGRYKIYLIDEVHMLSIHSFNALLKTLEEPPEHVKFLLATTNPQKLPTTILSRCIQFNLKSVDLGRLSAQLEKILDAEKIKYQSSALMVLARSANGSVRDALSLLDQAIAFSNGEIGSEQVRAMLGMVDDQFTVQLLTQIIRNQADGVLETISQMAERSVDYGSAVDELLTLIHNVSLFQVSPQAVEWKGIDSADLGGLAESVDAETLQLLYQIAIMGKRDFDFAPDPRSGFEMALIRMLAFQPRRRDGANDASTARPKVSPTEKITSPKQEKPEQESHVQEKPEQANKAQPIISNNAEAAKADCGAAPRQQIGKSSTTPAIIDIQKFMQADGWQSFINSSGLGGISKEILMNMVPKSVDGKIVNLTLDSASSRLFNNGRLQKIEQHCKDNLSLDIQFNVEIDDLSDADHEIETPTQQLTRQQKEKASAARQAFIHDANVQELVDLFDAEIVNQSIKPG
ncbi:DNA polymerase III subunit gamma/tau [Candidatus Spongiihabitans sp.]|uniref:DNA polymerase III subunit gamma/tau n=1 Tax=Candidatus Spongiihabitans sp. TaxID=3101308 RepID=UPI003C7DB42D